MEMVPWEQNYHLTMPFSHLILSVFFHVPEFSLNDESFTLVAQYYL